MRRTKIIVASIIALIIIVSIIIICNHFFVKPTVINQTESITLSIENDEKTSGFFGFTAGFPWKSGELKLKVNSCEIFDNLNEVESMSDEDKKYIESTHFFTKADKKMFGELDFMLVDITLENVNAVFDKDEYMLVNFFYPMTREAFYKSNVNLEYYLSECLYFDNHQPLSELAKENYKNYFSTKYENLAVGESYRFKLGFYIDEKTAESNNIILKIGTSNHNKYGIVLDFKENTND